MNDRPNFAPGCFGEISTFKNDDVCNACVFNQTCRVAHENALRQFREFHGIKERNLKSRGELSDKTRKIFEELGKSASEIATTLAEGRNPFLVHAGFIGIVCHLLLMQETISRKRIASIMTAHKGYNENTSYVYTRHAVQILAHCGAVDLDGDDVTLVRG